MKTKEAKRRVGRPKGVKNKKKSVTLPIEASTPKVSEKKSYSLKKRKVGRPRINKVLDSISTTRKKAKKFFSENFKDYEIKISGNRSKYSYILLSEDGKKIKSGKASNKSDIIQYCRKLIHRSILNQTDLREPQLA